MEKEPKSMEKAKEAKEKEIQIQAQISFLNPILEDYRQKVYASEEILWDLKRNLEMAQRKMFALASELSADELLALRSGLTVKQIQIGKALLANLQAMKLKPVDQTEAKT